MKAAWITYWTKRKAAFRYAFQGLVDLVRHHPHAHLHALATLAVLLLATYLGCSRWEWVSLLLSMAIVWVAEALNTALEYLTDLASPDQHPLAGKAKDMAAAAVLLASLFAAVVAMLIFWPYCRQYLGIS